MKSQEIVKGDQLRDHDGTLIYTVEDVTTRPPHVVATVRYNDGGTGERMWEIGKDAPLTRP